MTLDQIKKITQVQESNKPVYIVKSLPQGSPEVSQYLLIIAPNVGLCKVSALSKPITTESTGAQLRSEFTSYVNVLSEKYGPVSKKMDFLHAGAIYAGSKYWMRSLLEEERDLSYYWINSSKDKLPDSIETIDLSANAASQVAGILTVTYEFKNMAKCQATLEAEAKHAKKGSMKNF